MTDRRKLGLDFTGKTSAETHGKCQCSAFCEPKCPELLSGSNQNYKKTLIKVL